ncbi:hypothetical protein [Paeniglutamicibacter sp. NPDC091659]|uniref:hypothetical protein n=1 Tax=Paeniglutamicibacter sp. NPDC091659 TaxID=3364389 RepID=UPI00380324C3
MATYERSNPALNAWAQGMRTPSENLGEMLAKALKPTLLPAMRNAFSPHMASVGTSITEMMKVHVDTNMHQVAIGESFRSLYTGAFRADLFKFPMKEISEMVGAPWRNSIAAADFGSSISKMMTASIPKASVSAIQADIWTPITESIDGPFIDQLLANQEALQQEIEALEVEQFAVSFFEDQPVIAASIEQLQLPDRLSPLDRAAIILFVKIYVALLVAQVMLNISVENPALFTILGIAGLGSAPAASEKVGKIAEKALNKIAPPEDD